MGNFIVDKDLLLFVLVEIEHIGSMRAVDVGIGPYGRQADLDENRRLGVLDAYNMIGQGVDGAIVRVSEFKVEVWEFGPAPARGADYLSFDNWKFSFLRDRNL